MRTLFLFLAVALQLGAELKPAERLRLLRQSIEKSRLGGQPEALAKDLLAAAVLGNSLGRYDASYADAAEVLRLLPETAKQLRSQAENHQGNARLYQARYAEALDHYRASLRMTEETGDIEAQVYRWNNIGAANYFQGAYGQAWDAYSAAETLLRAAQGEWTAKARSTTLVNQATLLQKLGRLREALLLYRKVVNNDAESVADAQQLANLGALYRRLGDPYKAVSLYRRALAVFESHQDADGVLGTRENLAMALYRELDETAEARRLLQAVRADSLRVGNQREALVAELNLGQLEQAAGNPVAAKQAWTTALAEARQLGMPERTWPAYVGLAGIARAEGNASLALSLVEQAIAAIELVRGGVKSGKQRLEFLSDKRDAYDLRVDLLLDRNLADDRLIEAIEMSRSRAFQDQVTPAKLATLSARLGDSDVMVISWVWRKKMAWVVIDRDASRLVQFDGVSKTASPKEWMAQAFGSKSYRNLYLVPDQWLAGMDWDGPAAVRLLPAAAMLDPRSSARRVWPWERILLAVGVGQPSATATALAGSALPPLPNVGSEIDAVGWATPGRATVELDAAASHATVKESLGSFPLVHFAGHALADVEDGGRSQLVLYDMPLYGREIEEAKLDRVQLAVLSGCSTAQGSAMPGEGTESLARLFLRAGVKTVVATQWPVEDRAARDLIADFYGRMAEGTPPARALADAKTAMRSTHPEAAGAFVLWGNGNAGFERAIPIRYGYLLAGLLAGGTLWRYFSSTRRG